MGVKLTEKLAVVSVIDPDAYSTGTQDGDWVDLGTFRRAMFIFKAGTLGTSATLDGDVQQAQDSSGTGVKAITGKAITQLTESGTDSDKQAIVEVADFELDVEGGFTHVRPRLMIGVATSDAGAIGLAGVPRYHPASDNDLASVDEIVS